MLGGGGTTASVSSGGGRNGSNEAAAPVAVFDTNDGNSNNSGEDDRSKVDEGDRSIGGNRWPRQETLALLKIRSDMDVTFREASVKGPLWEEVSRKLAELGYHRSAKKCKEKFENVYKYHKRTKDGRSGKADGKTYRFFDQLEAFQNQPSIQWPPPPPMAAAATINQSISAIQMPNSTSSSTSSDLELQGRKKRKRKWKDFFERLMKEVIQKQQVMQKTFLEAIEKHERERIVRDEAWKVQEMSRLNREREILAQERSIAAAKDAAVMAFLQKLSEKQNLGQSQNSPLQPPAVVPAAVAPPPDNGNQIQTHTPSSSRWPKVEIEALIKIRTSLDSKYQDNSPKGPLWEEISNGMKKLGYNRNAKRCKEKWENINKYFKKVKESNKQRPVDSKTCPYFHQLDVLYREKNKHDCSSKSNPLMVLPEKQWPPPLDPHQQHHDTIMEDLMESDQNDDEEEDEGGSYELVASKPVSMGTAE
ncbi:hypothetical protein Goshw_005388 [Gossypium schwendimanii]|uniref:Myb-like domain-containing protein n=1 Tax=Gossypium schwendimanii TaxID=34291 RepID=A0A7J9KQA9_GOSSC|nr:hypothetical protein [Gossypium schwendimanii]